MAFFLIVLMLIFGLFFIIKGSDWATESLAHVSKKFGTTYIFVGIILVSFMVSLPEIAVAGYTAMNGHVEIAFGVIIGSIVCNIGLMVGLSAMIRPLRVPTSLIVRDGIFAVCAAVLVYVLSLDNSITRAEGFALFLIFVPYVINVWLQEKQKLAQEKEKELKEIQFELKIMGMQIGELNAGLSSFFIGFALLLLGSYLFSEGLIRTSAGLGISDLLIGLTIGAVGPSIPNIAAALQATKKHMEDVAVAETLGSDIFTLLISLGVLSLVKPITLTDKMLAFDIPAMVLFSFLLLFFMIGDKNTITKAKGTALFVGYLFILFINFFLR
ncbi:MAG: sodium:calcium antiporter [Candidatus Woesearchaeota archaeon]